MPDLGSTLHRLTGGLTRRPAAPPDKARGSATNPYPKFPRMGRQHIAGAQLFADRKDLIATLLPEPGMTVAEVGVGYGDFSAFLVEQLRPAKFVAIDAFRMHSDGERIFWGRTAQSMFGDLTHAEFYRRRFAELGDRLSVEEGLSWEMLARYPDEFFDVIYIDAAHDYESVRRDADVAVAKVKRDGMLIFNDYTMFDHVGGVPYGVVQNVNRLVVHGGWHVVGFALQWNLFCDIAIRREEVVQRGAKA